MTWLGHATTLIELRGARLLTDPLLRFAAHVAALAPTTRVAVLEPGDALTLP